MRFCAMMITMMVVYYYPAVLNGRSRKDDEVVEVVKMVEVKGVEMVKMMIAVRRRWW